MSKQQINPDHDPDAKHVDILIAWFVIAITSPIWSWAMLLVYYRFIY